MPVQILSDEATSADTGTLAPNASLEQKAIHALRNVYDPELPLNIYDLGLIYKITLNEPAGTAHLLLTLTAPNCPVADELPKQAAAAVQAATNLATAFTLTFDPPWQKENLPLEAKLALGIL